MRTIRRASRSTTSILRGSLPQRSPNSVASGDGSMVRRSTTCPSALETILCVTTTMSPGFEPLADAAIASPIERRQIVAGRHLGHAVDADDPDLAAVAHPTPAPHAASDQASAARTVRRQLPEVSPNRQAYRGRRRSRARRAPRHPTRAGAPRRDAWPDFPRRTQTESGRRPANRSSKAFVPSPRRSGPSTTGSVRATRPRMSSGDDQRQIGKQGEHGRRATVQRPRSASVDGAIETGPISGCGTATTVGPDPLPRPASPRRG